MNEADPWAASETLLLPVDTGEEVGGIQCVHLRDIPQLSATRFRYDNHCITIGAEVPFGTLYVKEIGFKDDPLTKVVSNILEHKIADGLEILGWCPRPELRPQNGYGILVFDSNSGNRYWFHAHTARYFHDCAYNKGSS